jgi:hypothetical protein
MMEENKKLKEHLSKIHFLAFNNVHQLKRLKENVKSEVDSFDANFDKLIKIFEEIEKLSEIK